MTVTAINGVVEVHNMRNEMVERHFEASGEVRAGDVVDALAEAGVLKLLCDKRVTRLDFEFKVHAGVRELYVMSGSVEAGR